ncbi:DUF7666 domain-containing protein [Hymenobacter lapidiphilus]|uniref:DUF7666 domain-containing protein n=1 Tax=Hymenobacter lapidiphilus TaxID=2608003 RepID=UPI001FE8F642|nr:hypothetical protein [Hymenobacter lapidiphilus]
MKAKKTHLITPEKPVLVLRVCAADMSAYNGFIWPVSGPVAAPDWLDSAECGNGLHGWLWGEGDHSVATIREDSKWLVVKVAAYVELQGKVKYPQGEVVCCGDRLEATAYLAANGGQGRAIIGGTATAGDRGTATAGYRGTATAGYAGTATAGYAGTATAGDAGTATAGDAGTATAGYRGTATAGEDGTATAGYAGTATAGNRGTATAGEDGTATAGDAGTATAGDAGTATAGNRGTATAGEDGSIFIKRWNGKRYRFHMANVSENGIKPNVAYKLDEAGNFIEA